MVEKKQKALIRFAFQNLSKITNFVSSDLILHVLALKQVLAIFKAKRIL